MEQFKNLPVFKEFEKIKQKWSENSHLILRSPTGSGKSLALPYLLKESGLVQGKILVAQPRRIAARMLAKNSPKYQIGNWAIKWDIRLGLIKFIAKKPKFSTPLMELFSINFLPEIVLMMWRY